MKKKIAVLAAGAATAGALAVPAYVLHGKAPSHQQHSTAYVLHGKTPQVELGVEAAGPAYVLHG
jgi:hypothetical protein